MTTTPTPETIKELVDRFLAWPLPKSVCSDICATVHNYAHTRSGTNLLTAVEAEQMLRHVVGALIAERDILTGRVQAAYAERDDYKDERDQALARVKELETGKETTCDGCTCSYCRDVRAKAHRAALAKIKAIDAP